MTRGRRRRDDDEWDDDRPARRRRVEHRARGSSGTGLKVTLGVLSVLGLVTTGFVVLFCLLPMLAVRKAVNEAAEARRKADAGATGAGDATGGSPAVPAAGPAEAPLGAAAYSTYQQPWQVELRKEWGKEVREVKRQLTEATALKRPRSADGSKPVPPEKAKAEIAVTHLTRLLQRLERNDPPYLGVAAYHGFEEPLRTRFADHWRQMARRLETEVEFNSCGSAR